MCGIAAVLGDRGGFRNVLLDLRHRGPDAEGEWSDGSCWLGARRLRINGGGEGDMPLFSASKNIALVANGEIFNHRELFPGAGASDLDGLADAFEREGVALFRRLRGPFALCLYDRRDQSLTIARDEIGVRPLFLREERGSLFVASEIPPLRRRADAPDHTTWAHLLAFQFWPTGATPWRPIRSVVPGTWQRFRKIDDRLVSEAGSFAYEGTEGDPAVALRTAFALQARNDADTGLFLSGGLDSSAVAGLLHALGTPPTLAAVGWFPEADAALDERGKARAVADELSIPLIDVPIRPLDWCASWERLIERLGGPLAGPGGPSQWIVARELARAGTRVVYTGQGGDELFGGYERHRLLRQLDRGEPLVPAAGYEPLAAAMSAGDPLKGALFRGAAVLEFLEPEARTRVLAAAATLPEPGPGRAERTVRFERRHLLPGLLDVDDRVVSAFGMEGRVPLLDPGFVALIERERPEVRVGRERFLEIVGAALPFSVRHRKDKMGFPLPLCAWFKGPLAEYRRDHPGLDRLTDIGLTREGIARLKDGLLSARTTYFLLSAAMTLAGFRPASSSCAQQL